MIVQRQGFQVVGYKEYRYQGDTIEKWHPILVIQISQHAEGCSCISLILKFESEILTFLHILSSHLPYGEEMHRVRIKISNIILVVIGQQGVVSVTL